MEDAPDEITELVRAIPDAPIALELQWELVDDDDGPGTCWVLALHVIVEKPGRDHSRYSTVRVARFDAEDESSRREAHARSRAVAERVGLPLHAPPVEHRGGTGGSQWIRDAGAGPEVSYDVRWEASWWTDDGEHHAASGAEPVRATTGFAACVTLERELKGRIADRPLMLRTFLGEDRGPTYVLGAPHRAALPHPDVVRAVADAEAWPPSRVAAWLVAQDAQATALDLMVVFAGAFDLAMETCAPLARWRRGAIDGAPLDAALEPMFERARRYQDPVRALRTARRMGESVAARVRAERGRGRGTAVLVTLVQQAFCLPLAEAMAFVRACDDPGRDAELDAKLVV